MTTVPARYRSHSDLRAALSRVGVPTERIDEILAAYPDPVDMNEAEASLFEKYGITQETLSDRMGGSP
jgi:SOS response regulatory protein OraA/RecX